MFQSGIVKAGGVMACILCLCFGCSSWCKTEAYPAFGNPRKNGMCEAGL